MLLPARLYEKALFWGPLFVGLIFLIGGLVGLKSQFVQGLHQEIVAARLIRLEAYERAQAALRRERAAQRARVERQALMIGAAAPAFPHQALDGGPYALAFLHVNEHMELATLIGAHGHGGSMGLDAGLFSANEHYTRQLVAANGLISGRVGAAVHGKMHQTIATLAALPLHHTTEKFAQFSGLEAPAGFAGAVYGEELGRGFRQNEIAAQYGALKGFLGKQTVQDVLRRGEAAGKHYAMIELGERLSPSAEGGGADEVIAGLEASQGRASLLFSFQQGARFGVLSSRPSVSYVQLALRGLDNAVERYSLLQNADGATDELALDLTFSLKGEGGDPASQNCAENFYRVVSLLNKNNVAPLNKTLKQLFETDKTLPGAWIFAPGTKKRSRVCTAYKTTASGRRKCKKWEATAALPGGVLSSEEQAYFQRANVLISSRGLPKDMKRTSGNGWVMTRVAQSLQFYTKQPPHPAICTGAPRMVDYFEKHLASVRTMVGRQLGLMRHAGALLDARRLYVEELLTRQAEAARIALEMRYIETKLAAVDDPDQRLDSGQLVELPSATAVSIPPFDAGTLQTGVGSLALVLWGPALEEKIAAAKDTIAALRIARQAFSSGATRIEINAITRSEIWRLYSLIEASYYNERRHELLEKVSHQLFGTLQGLKEGHRLHCTCQ